jgi:hypothetical protein
MVFPYAQSMEVSRRARQNSDVARIVLDYHARVVVYCDGLEALH